MVAVDAGVVHIRCAFTWGACMDACACLLSWCQLDSVSTEYHNLQHMHVGIGANLVSAAFEPNCTLLVGASGAVFGFMGLFVADLVVNFESISWPFLRVLCIVLFVVFFIVNALSDDSSPRVSHASHVGGLVCGLFPSLLFLPNLRNKRIRALKRQMETGEGPASGATVQCAPICLPLIVRKICASCLPFDTIQRLVATLGPWCMYQGITSLLFHGCGVFRGGFPESPLSVAYMIFARFYSYIEMCG